MPIFYFNGLIGLALGHPEVADWLAVNLVNPRSRLEQKGGW